MIDFIIIGAQKAGTTAAAYNLNKHPKISINSGKNEYGRSEVEYYNKNWEKGSKWYFDQLPTSHGIVGEKTAELFHRTITHKRIFQTQPNVKLILLLRCPIERAFSQWRMAYFNKRDENRSFEEVILKEYEYINDFNYKTNFYSCEPSSFSNWREGYIIKGFYSEQILSLYSYFSKQNIHIAISEYVTQNKDIEYNRMFSFLNVSPFICNFENKFIGNTSNYISKKTINLLKEIYRNSNKEVFEILGFKIKEWLN